MSGSSIQINNPLPYSGNHRFVIKRNDSTSVEWITLNPVYVSATAYRFYIPTQYIIDLTLTTGVSYIWKYMIYDSPYYTPYYR